MDSVSPEEGGTIPREIKIFDKTYIVSSAGGLEPSVEVEDSTDTPSSTGQCGNSVRNKNRLSTSTSKAKKVVKGYIGNIQQIPHDTNAVILLVHKDSIHLDLCIPGGDLVTALLRRHGFHTPSHNLRQCHHVSFISSSTRSNML